MRPLMKALTCTRPATCVRNRFPDSQSDEVLTKITPSASADRWLLWRRIAFVVKEP
jgi:hypothetical protein